MGQLLGGLGVSLGGPSCTCNIGLYCSNNAFLMSAHIFFLFLSCVVREDSCSTSLHIRREKIVKRWNSVYYQIQVCGHLELSCTTGYYLLTGEIISSLEVRQLMVMEQ